MSEKDPGKQLTAQIVGHRSLKVAGGLRVELDFFDARPEDVCYMTILSIEKATIDLDIKPHDKKDDNKKEKRFGRSKKASD